MPMCPQPISYIHLHIKGFVEIIDPLTGEGKLVKFDRDIDHPISPLKTQPIDPNRVARSYPDVDDPTLTAFYDPKATHD